MSCRFLRDGIGSAGIGPGIAGHCVRVRAKRHRQRPAVDDRGCGVATYARDGIRASGLADARFHRCRRVGAGPAGRIGLCAPCHRPAVGQRGRRIATGGIGFLVKNVGERGRGAGVTRSIGRRQPRQRHHSAVGEGRDRIPGRSTGILVERRIDSGLGARPAKRVGRGGDCTAGQRGAVADRRRRAGRAVVILADEVRCQRISHCRRAFADPRRDCRRGRIEGQRAAVVDRRIGPSAATGEGALVNRRVDRSDRIGIGPAGDCGGVERKHAGVGQRVGGITRTAGGRGLRDARVDNRIGNRRQRAARSGRHVDRQVAAVRQGGQRVAIDGVGDLV